jgi:maltooligosyltrehalose trehalohydrolase
MSSTTKRRLPIGAEVVDGGGGGGGVHFRVWAPKRDRVEVITAGCAASLTRETDREGYFSGLVESARAGDRYKLRLDGAEAYPDPASRFQPDGPHGESQVIDHTRFKWTDRDWHGSSPKGQILYEMHIGTYTPQGTFAAAAGHLPELVDLGITLVEIMPVAEFPGRFGWGYDGVDLFAPYHMYGAPDDFRAFVDRAHQEGIGVILDVVYNHFGPDGNYLGQFADAYVSARHKTEWGDAVNFDGPDCRAVREFVLSNVRHWISEYHVDGLRLDATHSILDDSEPHILEDIGTAAREAAGGRQVVIIAESEPQDGRIVRPRDRGGYGLDQIWCDDFHHTALVAAHGKREAYFTDYRGTPQELVSALKHGILYQGQRYTWQKKRRGTPAWDLDPHQLVFYLENHDQVANSRDGRRLHQLTPPGRYRALSAVLMLARQTPMLFQGQEFGASAPFLYFADHNPELSQLVRTGRGEFLRQFASIAAAGVHTLDDPAAAATFERSRLDHGERKRNVQHYALYRDLIALRRCDPVLSSEDTRVDGAVLGDHAFAIRFFARDGAGANDRLLVVNLGSDLALEVAPEPLLAPPDLGTGGTRGWQRLWYSDDPCYGGRGAQDVEEQDGTWRIPTESATLLEGAG